MKTTNTPNNIISVIISLRVCIMNIRRKCSKRDNLNKICFYINVVSIMASYILLTNFVSRFLVKSCFKSLTIHQLITSIKSYQILFRENNDPYHLLCVRKRKMYPKYHNIHCRNHNFMFYGK